jgi:hypothetical protein
MNYDDTIEMSMTQTGLINSIIEDLSLNTSSSKFKRHDTPVTEILQQDLAHPPFVETWSYCSVIGKPNFLAQNTRPDITYAIHQCARFCQNPCTPHGAAIKHIGCYLKSTHDKGLILPPDGTNSLHNAYCDSDFCGTWTAGLPTFMDPVSPKPVSSSPTATALFSEQASYKQRLPSALAKRNTLP